MNRTGQPENNELVIAAELKNLPLVLDFIEGHLEGTSISIKQKMQILVAVEEIFVNIASYAYAPGTGDAVVRCEILDDPAAVEIEFEDTGTPYNPLEKEDPDVTLSAEERSIGGLGVFLVKKLMDDVRYEYRDGANVLTVRKLL
jgi:anti-sigma regulatory factor (Ser/Thr protein kinase)